MAFFEWDILELPEIVLLASRVGLRLENTQVKFLFFENIRGPEIEIGEEILISVQIIRGLVTPVREFEVKSDLLELFDGPFVNIVA